MCLLFRRGRERMIRRTTFINKIRELGFTFKREQRRTQLWRKSGTTDCISVPTKDLLDEVYVKSSLFQAGLSKDEVDAFFAANRCH